MRLAVFDIDGTLTQSSTLDDSSFQRTARELLGLAQISLDWSTYPHSTDDAIAAHLTRLARGRSAERAEINAFRAHFMHVLGEELSGRAPIAPVAGAREVLARVKIAGWTPAVATGCWRVSALAKLGSAGLSLAGVGAAFADDAWPRELIIARAAERACAIAQASGAHASGAPPEPQDVVYLGDGIWDVRACRTAGYRFVGIAEGPRAAALRQEGASTVLAGFAEHDALLDALEHATVPRST